MIFNKEEYKVSDDEITISMATLEAWKTHCCNVMDKVDDGKKMFYMGKISVLADILKHFDYEEEI